MDVDVERCLKLEENNMLIMIVFFIKFFRSFCLNRLHKEVKLKQQSYLRSKLICSFQVTLEFLVDFDHLILDLRPKKENNNERFCLS